MDIKLETYDIENAIDEHLKNDGIEIKDNEFRYKEMHLVVNRKELEKILERTSKDQEKVFIHFDDDTQLMIFIDRPYFPKEEVVKKKVVKKKVVKKARKFNKVVKTATKKKARKKATKKVTKK